MDAPLCNCQPAQPALRLVWSVGPDKGRTFYRCAKPRETACGFVQRIAPPDDSIVGVGRVNVRSAPMPPPPPQPAERLPPSSASAPPPLPDGLQTITCDCKLVAKRFTVRKDGPNKGRVFYCCGQEKSPSATPCRYWKWHEDLQRERDDPHAPEEREVVLHQRIYAQQGRARIPLGSEGASAAAAPGPAGGDAPSAKEQVDAARAKRQQPTRRDLVVEVFARLAESRGYAVRFATPYEQVYQHRDVRITRGVYDDEEVWVCVQAARKANLADADMCYDRHWVPVHSARSDDAGYVIGGYSDVVAFEGDCGFTVADRKSLWRYLDVVVPKQETMLASDTVATTNRMYRAPGVGVRVGQKGHDLRVLVPLDDLRDFAGDKQRNPDAKPVLVDYWPIDEPTRKSYREPSGTVEAPKPVTAPPTPAAAAVAMETS